MQDFAFSSSGGSGSVGGVGGGGESGGWGDASLRLDMLGGAPQPRTLVVRSTEKDAKNISTLEEDLNVMSRIFSKALTEKNGEDDTVTAMGMSIKTLTQSYQAGVQNLYLDGYGALFMLHVRFPLLAPPEPPKDDESSKESKDSTWEETKRELYGPKEPLGASGRVFFSKDKGREPFDAKRVARLKDALIESLKNASNIRNLRPEEFVTVVVIGSDNTPVTYAYRSGGPGREQNHFAAGQDYQRNMMTRYGVGLGRAPVSRMSGNETVMTLRAKKADIDACAKGDLKFEDFQKKVSSAIY